MLPTYLLLSLIFNSVHCTKTNCETAVDCADWDYQSNDDAHYWQVISKCPDTKCPSSSGQQSPVNIITTQALETCSASAKLEMRGLYEGEFEIENDAGHFNILIKPEHSSAPWGELKNGIDDTEYCLTNIHLHWQSEHQIDGKHSAVEAHFVHYKCSHGGVATAIASGENNALAVVAVMFDVGSNDNVFLKRIADKIDDIVDGCTTTLIEGKISQLLPISSLNPFYKYEGSLTTPKCNPVVLWHVVQCKLSISASTLSAFSRLKGGYGQTYDVNYRAVQTLNNPLFVCPSNSDSDDNDESQCSNGDGDDDDDDALLWDFNFGNNTNGNNPILLLVMYVFIVLTLVNTFIITYKHCTRNKAYVHVPIAQKYIDP